jgi:hypothetical protein
VRRASGNGAKVEGLSQALVRVSRLLICLIGLLLIVSPWTEYYGTFDNFPHGQDFELSLLAFLALLCLVLVLAQRRHQGMKVDRAVRHWLSLLLRTPLPLEPLLGEVECVSHAPPHRGLRLSVFNLPLQI